jgi:pre-rRNA-processing protein TSR4
LRLGDDGEEELCKYAPDADVTSDAIGVGDGMDDDDSSSQGSDDEDGYGVSLGYVSEVAPENAHILRSKFFPSKLGGKPAWIQPSADRLPAAHVFSCDHCGLQLVFLLQVYAPLDHLNPDAFHRSLFVFICLNGICLATNKSVVVIRQQLPQHNALYAPEPSDPDDPECEQPFDGWQSRCCVCGVPAPLKCGACKQLHYCSQQHQRVDWPFHSGECAAFKAAGTLVHCTYTQRRSHNGVSRHAVKEMILDVEDEVLEDEASNAALQRMRDDDVSGTSKMQEFGSMKGSVRPQVDPFLLKFQTRVSFNPDQVLRYSLKRPAPSPLWLTSTPLPPACPPCELCGGARCFEFQVLSTPRIMSCYSTISVSAADQPFIADNAAVAACYRR